MQQAEAQFAATLHQAIEYAAELEHPELEGVTVESFEQAGLMTGNAGLVVTLEDGSAFQVTVVQRKGADR